jgi:hypothetical protein
VFQRDLSIIPKESSKVLSNITSKLIESPEIDWEELSFHQNGGPVLQCLFDALRVHKLNDLLDKLTAKLLFFEFDEENSYVVFCFGQTKENCSMKTLPVQKKSRPPHLIPSPTHSHLIVDNLPKNDRSLQNSVRFPLGLALFRLSSKSSCSREGITLRCSFTLFLPRRGVFLRKLTFRVQGETLTPRQ